MSARPFMGLQPEKTRVTLSLEKINIGYRNCTFPASLLIRSRVLLGQYSDLFTILRL